jgi:hypothetical protein
MTERAGVQGIPVTQNPITAGEPGSASVLQRTRLTVPIYTEFIPNELPHAQAHIQPDPSFAYDIQFAYAAGAS